MGAKYKYLYEVASKYMLSDIVTPNSYYIFDLIDDIEHNISIGFPTYVYFQSLDIIISEFFDCNYINSEELDSIVNLINSGEESNIIIAIHIIYKKFEENVLYR